ncbi:carbohydrate ABC transporter permease [Candidatus Epulonipiscium viviparus]|uniref:carbohydrate ABC transporter permease n=1 Tax=Candidatus Epulonipiscium viviparus TaxID=420336 RepID=UPI0027380B40|nr:carbohydrate ABC transporter permease [Candidatus Epulopiscium viviparus]
MKEKVTAFDYFNVAALTLLCILTLYPIIYVMMSSISDPVLLQQQEGIMLYPLGFSLEAYKLVFDNPSVLIGYRNTLFYVAAGTAINMFMTILGAFALSRRDLYIRKFLTIVIIFTMQFGGGLIPTFLVVSGMLGESIWTQLLPGAIVTSNLIIMRTGFFAIPDSLEESAKIDGANDWVVLTNIILPLSKPTLAVIALYYGVGHWNSWLPATIYLRDRTLFPLQLFLREILLQNQLEETVVGVATGLQADMSDVIKYATIIVAIIPVLCVYPFVQKYFVKGVMIGAVKG